MERERLIEMFREHVCPDTCNVVVKMMRERELRRLVFTGMYVRQYKAWSKRGRLIQRIADNVGISRTTAWEYAKEYDSTRVQQVQ